MEENSINSVKILVELGKRDEDVVLISKVYYCDSYECSCVSDIDLVSLVKSSKEAIDEKYPDTEKNYQVFLNTDLVNDMVSTSVSSAKAAILSEIAKYSSSLDSSSQVLDLTEEQKQYVTTGKKVISSLLTRLNEE